MKSLVRLFRYLSMLGPIGPLPASGTVASVVTALVVAVFGLQELPQFPVIILLISLISSIAVEVALPTFYSHDPRQVVLDEVVGFLIGCYFIPASWLWLTVLLAFFRFFDIIKPLGLRKLEYLPGVQGVMFDDIGAGIYAGICTCIVRAVALKLFV